MRNATGDEEVQRITGNRIAPYYSSAKLQWIKYKEPQIFSRIHCVLQANSYLNFRLTNVKSNDQAHAGLTGLFDIETEKWSSFLCKAWGVPEEILPPVYHSSDIIGTVTKEASDATGLPEGVPVVAGTVDASAAALEAGILEPDEAVETTGTSSVLMIGCKEMPKTHSLVALYHAIENRALLIGPISSTGSSLKWFRDTLGHQECKVAQDNGVNPYSIMDEEAGPSSACSSNLLFLPYMAGERAPIWNTDARGVFFGLNLSTSRGDMIRAILEGGAFALKHNLLEAQKAGHTISSITAAGGGASSDIWLEIKASILGIPVVRLNNSNSGAFGNALIAAMGTGNLCDPKTVLRQYLTYEKTFEPNEALQNHLERKYRVFRSLYEHTKDDFKQLNQIRDSE
jgi:xylulokinase